MHTFLLFTMFLITNNNYYYGRIIHVYKYIILLHVLQVLGINYFIVHDKLINFMSA